MLDAYASVGLPLMYRHWSFGKRFAYHETLYRKGLPGLAYEIVINSNPVHLLHHGRELHDHADAGHGACRVWPQPLLQEQLFVPAVDRCRRHPRLSELCPRLCRQMRGEIRVRGGRARARRRARAEGPRRQPLRPPLASRTSPRSGAGPRNGSAHDEATFNDLWRTVPGTGQGQGRPRRGRSAAAGDQARSRPARGKPALFHRKARAAARRLAARADPHRPP